jgi:hypothetical protein
MTVREVKELMTDGDVPASERLQAMKVEIELNGIGPSSLEYTLLLQSIRLLASAAKLLG